MKNPDSNMQSYEYETHDALAHSFTMPDEEENIPQSELIPFTDTASTSHTVEAEKNMTETEKQLSDLDETEESLESPADISVNPPDETESPLDVSEETSDEICVNEVEAVPDQDKDIQVSAEATEIENVEEQPLQSEGMQEETQPLEPFASPDVNSEDTLYPPDSVAPVPSKTAQVYAPPPDLPWKKLEMNALPSFSGKNQVRLLNSVLTKQKDYLLQLADEEMRFRFLPPQPQVNPSVGIGLKTGLTRIDIWLENASFIDMLAGSDFSRIPTEIREAVLEAYMEELLDGFDRKTGMSSSIEAITFNYPANAVPEHMIFFQLLRCRDNRSVTGFFTFTKDDLPGVESIINALPRSSSPLPETLPLLMRVEIGRTLISLEEMKDLELNDIIIMDNARYHKDKAVTVRIEPSIAFHATVDAENVIIENLVEVDMSEELNIQEEKAGNDIPQEEQASSIDNIAVNLIFDLGGKRITLGELKTIQPGYTFNLEKNLDKLITIRANGKVIGSGELVTLDEHIGVKVLELFSNANND